MVIYYSTSYSRDKQDNTYCCYHNQNGSICFGQIDLFTSTPIPQAFV